MCSGSGCMNGVSREDYCRRKRNVWIPFGSMFVNMLKPFVLKISLVTRDQSIGAFGVLKELVLNSGTKFEAATDQEMVEIFLPARPQNNRGNGFVCTVMLAELFEMNG